MLFRSNDTGTERKKPVAHSSKIAGGLSVTSASEADGGVHVCVRVCISRDLFVHYRAALRPKLDYLWREDGPVTQAGLWASGRN